MRLKRFNVKSESKKLVNKQKREYQVKSRTLILSIGILICSIILCTYAAFKTSGKVDVMKSSVGNLEQIDYILNAYVDGVASNTMPDEDDGYTVDHITCTNGATGTWKDVDWGILLTNATEPTECNIYFVEYDEESEFDYTGNIQTFRVPRTGTYKLEVWGAQGGLSIATGELTDTGGYGGYSTGNISLSMDDVIYVTVGGKGEDGTLTTCAAGGFNGGGIGTNDGDECNIADDDEAAGGGGGATHIASETGLLSDLSLSRDSIIIVAGGGGGGSWIFRGGSGGGFKGGIGGASSAATQIDGYAFGQGQNASGIGDDDGLGGGGGGYYGGYQGIGHAEDWGGSYDMAGGGSGYIASSRLISYDNVTKHMYCYDCTTSNNSETKTNSNGTSSCHDDDPTADCAKEGNGYAKITLLSVG